MSLDVAQRPEIVVQGFAADVTAQPDQLDYTIDGKPHWLTLRIARLGRFLVANLPDVGRDLIEIVALVYAADCAVSRGGPTDAQMGKFWRRSFAFKVPVRCPEIWSAPALRAALTETLSFLSDDAYCFDFRQAEKPLPAKRFFDFGSDDTLTPNSVLLFSGGLDSTAGALSELLDRGRRVALVSHQSSPKMARVQKDLVRSIGERAGFERVLHVPLSLQIAKGSNREGTHRSLC